MSSAASCPVIIQASSESVPSVPAWSGELTLIARHLEQQGKLGAVSERVRFARRRFGQYAVIDFFAVVLGNAVSGERTLEAFYKRVQPFARAFMALFSRKAMPHRSTPSHFLAALVGPVLRRCARCLSRTCWLDPCRVKNRAGCGTDRGTTGWCLMWTGPAVLPDSGLSPRPLTYPQQRGAWIRCVRRATPGASAARWCEPGRRFCKATRTSG